MTEKRQAVRRTLRMTAVGACMLIVIAGGITVSLGDALCQPAPRNIDKAPAHHPAAPDPNLVDSGLQQLVVQQKAEKLASRAARPLLPKQVKPVDKPRVKPTSAQKPVLEPPWLSFTATWYSGSGGSDGGCWTASGTHVQDGYTIAVDPSVIPLGSTVEVKFSDGRIARYHAVDTGGAIKGRRIDIFNSNRADCLRNGVQQVEIRILSA